MAKVRYVWEKYLSVPTSPSQLMRWRVRLFCGHIVGTLHDRISDDARLVLVGLP